MKSIASRLLAVTLLVFGLPVAALAMMPRQGAYSNFWSAGATKYALKIEGESYTAYLVTDLDKSPPAFAPIGDGAVSELQVVNECQLVFKSTLLTQQACEMAYDDSTNALRPSGVVVLPDVWFYAQPGVEAHYRVELVPAVYPGSVVALRVTKAEYIGKRGNNPTFFDADRGRLYLTVFVPTDKDCIESYDATLVRSATDQMILVVQQLTYLGQYQWWGGGNDSVCPAKPIQKLIN